MTHAEMNELYELYVLGAIEPELAGEIEEHLRTGCTHCTEQIQRARDTAAVLSFLAEAQEPPARLRSRVLASVQPFPRERKWLFAVAGLSAACVALLIVAVWDGNSLRASRARIASLLTERQQLQETVEILSKSDTRAVQFGRAAEPHGRVFINRNNGIIFVGSALPSLASDRTFQLWLIPATGAPESAGLFRPNSAGDFVQVRPTPIDTSRIRAVAVSAEPSGGSSAPTTKPILIVPLG